MSEQERDGLTIPGGGYSGIGDFFPDITVWVCVWETDCECMCVCLLTATYQGYYEGLSQE